MDISVVSSPKWIRDVRAVSVSPSTAPLYENLIEGAGMP